MLGGFWRPCASRPGPHAARPPAPASRIASQPAAVGIKFVDAAAGNFQLRDDSPVWKATGFGRIPTDRFGLEVDEFRDSQLWIGGVGGLVGKRAN